MKCNLFPNFHNTYLAHTFPSCNLMMNKKKCCIPLSKTHKICILSHAHFIVTIFFNKIHHTTFTIVWQNVLLLAMKGVASLLLNSTTTIVSTTFQIPTQRYLSILLEPSVIIECFKNTHVIIIDEMSMMPNMLCVVEQTLKQSLHFENIF
jgi:hypothetical protein